MEANESLGPLVPPHEDGVVGVGTGKGTKLSVVPDSTLHRPQTKV
jgi:hypothetical protein